MIAAAPVAAHPKLLASTPAENAVVTAPAQIKLEFSEKLFSKMSGAKLVRVDDQSVPAIAVSFGANRRSMQIAPVKPLAAGRYAVEWFGVAGDTHRVTGAMHLSVR